MNLIIHFIQKILKFSFKLGRFGNFREFYGWKWTLKYRDFSKFDGQICKKFKF